MPEKFPAVNSYIQVVAGRTEIVVDSAGSSKVGDTMGAGFSTVRGDE